MCEDTGADASYLRGHSNTSDWGDEDSAFPTVSCEDESEEDRCELQNGPPIERVLSQAPTERSRTRMRLRYFLLGLPCQFFMIIITLIDVACVIWFALLREYEEPDADMVLAFHRASDAATFLYTAELLLCAYAVGPLQLLRHLWHVADLLVVFTCVGLLVARESQGYDEGGAGAVPIIKVAKTAASARSAKNFLGCLELLKFVGVVSHKARWLPRVCRSVVSQNKFRYVNEVENFDLDLTYIDHDLIAMAVPVTGCLARLVRNPISDVARFFSRKHEGRVRIYNLCPEMPYPDQAFCNAVLGGVKRFYVQDHCPPTMDQLVDFLTDARQWRDSRKNALVAVHCKAGKGRTGCLCASWLLYCRVQRNADEALHMFARRRTDERVNGRLCGVETRSQIRYVHQLWHHLRRTDSFHDSPLPPPRCRAPPLTLHSLSLHGALLKQPHQLGRLRVLVQCSGAVFRGTRPCSVEAPSDVGTETVATSASSASRKDVMRIVYESPGINATAVTLPLEDIVVSGDVRISLFQERGAKFSASTAMMTVPNAQRAKGIICFFVFHTDFMNMRQAVLKPSVKNSLNDSGFQLEHRPSICSSPREPSQREDECGGPREFRVRVEDLDKAFKSVKKKNGKHTPGSSIVLSYTVVADAAADGDACKPAAALATAAATVGAALEATSEVTEAALDEDSYEKVTDVSI